MELVLTLEKEEATYTFDRRRWGHFAIDCSCGGTSGSKYKNANQIVEMATLDYKPLNKKDKFSHTFYIGEHLFKGLIETHTLFSKEEESNEALAIICRDCEREFSFTTESFQALKNEAFGLEGDLE